MRSSGQWLPRQMGERLRKSLIGGAGLVVLAVVAAPMLAAGGERGPDLPRLRVSVPGLDKELVDPI